MKTQDFAKLLRRVAKTGDQEVDFSLTRIATLVEKFPDGFRKGLQRVETEPDLTFEEMRQALVTIKLFLVQPTLADKFLDEPLRRRARIAMDVLWNALLTDYAVEASREEASREEEKS